MKLGRTSLLLLFLLMIAVGCTNVSVVNAPDGLLPFLSESVEVNVDCTTANVDVRSMVTSTNTSIIHFPSEVNMSDARLVNVTYIFLMFSTAGSNLSYVFVNTDPATAESIANDITSSMMESAFETDFTWAMTVSFPPMVTVMYTGPGKVNLAQYTEGLMPKCLAPGLGGFSLTFLPMAQEPNALTTVNALRLVGPDWVYQMMVEYSTTIPTGTGDHTIDILDLLNVISLAPSPYAYIEFLGTYSSTVSLTISSDQTVSYVSCQPGLAEPPNRGWSYEPPVPDTYLDATFNFANDPSAVSPLTFTFSGTVVPEFTTLTTITLLILVATAALIIKKRFPKI